jgi:Protein of unknown function (DUF3540)
MGHSARKVDRLDVVNELGAVRQVEVGKFVVETDSGEYRAKRALSCLVEPAAGDLVLVASHPSGASYVLAVLEREAGAPTRLTVEGDLDVCLAAGKFTVAAREGVGLASAKDVSVASASVSVTTGEMSFFGKVVRAEIAKVKLLAQSLDSVLERVSMRVKRSYRKVEEFEQLRTARLDYVVENEMSLHAENAIISAEEVVKIDAEQIRLA